MSSTTRRVPADSASSSASASPRSEPPRSSRLRRTYPRATRASEARVLPAPGMPITSTTSASSPAAGAFRRAERLIPKARESLRRSAAVSASPAARAAERAVSGRRAPGIGTTAGDRPSSHASATSAGVAACAAATPASTGSRAIRPPRSLPPSGECAITAMPAASHRSTTPPRSARSTNGLSATWTAVTGISANASSSCGRLTFATPTCRTSPSSSSRPSARSDVVQGVRGSGA